MARDHVPDSNIAIIASREQDSVHDGMRDKDLNVSSVVPKRVKEGAGGLVPDHDHEELIHSSNHQLVIASE